MNAVRGLRPLLLVGAGGLGREVLEVVRARNHVAPTFDVRGFLDDRPELHGTHVDGVPVVGPVALAAEATEELVLCTGSPRDPASRLRLAASIGDDVWFATLVHPGASVAVSAALGPGTVLLAGVVLTAAVAVGAHVVAMPHVVLTHDVRVGDGATFGAGARMAGGVEIGPGAYLGSGCLVREGCRVGGGATVGMGAVVLRDVPDGETWAGVPAVALDRSVTGRMVP